MAVCLPSSDCSAADIMYALMRGALRGRSMYLCEGSLPHAYVLRSRGACRAEHDWCLGHHLYRTVPGSVAAFGAAPTADHYVCADAGASVDKYYLGGKSSSSVRAGQGVLDVQSMAAARAPDGRLLAVFTIGMPQDAAALSADRPIM